MGTRDHKTELRVLMAILALIVIGCLTIPVKNNERVRSVTEDSVTYIHTPLLNPFWGVSETFPKVDTIEVTMREFTFIGNDTAISFKYNGKTVVLKDKMYKVAKHFMRKDSTALIEVRMYPKKDVYFVH